MPSFLRWLIGLKEPPDWVAGGSWRLTLQSAPEGAMAVVYVALGLAAIGGIWWLYHKEGREVGRAMRLALVALRFLVLVCVALMLLELVLVINKTNLIPSQLLVLVDNSESMNLKDPYTDTGEATRVAAAVGLVDKDGKVQPNELRKVERLNLARRAVADLLGPLSQDRQVSVYTFANRLEPLAKGQKVEDVKAKGSETAIGEAIKGALAAHRGQPIAGVLLVSDGQSNAGADPRAAAQQAGKEGRPIHVLAVGTEQGPANAEVVDIENSPAVFVRDTTEVAVLVASRGLQGQPATVSLELRPDGGQWSEIGREELTFGDDAAVKRIAFKHTPDATGYYDLRARLDVPTAELRSDDNVASGRLRVVRQKIRILAIAGYPSPEVQFIRNALLRDVALEFASWLQSATEGYEHVGHKPIRRLPATFDELRYYDAVILFDPDMRALGPQWSEMLTKFVGDAGGGLVYIAGELNTQPLFAGSGGESDAAGALDNGWLKTLPVATDPGLYQSAADVRLSAKETWTLELSGEGTADQIFRFHPDPNRNREVLASLPGMYWHFPVTRAKPGATVLARHGDPRMRNSYGRHVLLATQRYGPGRTVFIGFDSTYRWRYLDEAHFDGFWARLIDRVGRSKVLGGRYPFTLATDKSVYRAGDQVTLRATMVGSAEEAGQITDLRGEVEIAGQPPLPIELEPQPREPGVLEATFTASDAGQYLARIVPATSSTTTEIDTGMRPATLSFKVEPPRQELDRPKLDRGLLEDVARASAGGRTFSLANYREIPDAFQVKKVERMLEYRDEMWDSPLLFLAFLLLLTSEWVLRKMHRMA